MDVLALIASLGASISLIGLGLVVRRGRKPRTWSAVPGGTRRDFFGDRVDAAAEDAHRRRAA